MRYGKSGGDDRHHEQDRHPGPEHLSGNLRNQLNRVIARPHRSERHRPAMAYQAGGRRNRRRKPHDHHDGGYDRDRHTEAGDALHDRGKTPRHQQALHQPVIGDFCHIVADHLYGADCLHDVVKEDGTPNDEQHIKR